MTRYYSSLDHSDWAPPGGGSWTKKQFGDGASDYSALRTAALAAQSALSAAVMPDIAPTSAGLGGAQRLVSFVGPTWWDAPGVVDMVQLVPTHDVTRAASEGWFTGRTPGRNGALADPGLGSGYDPQEGGAQAVSFTASLYTDAVAAVDAIVAAAGSMSTLSADPLTRQRGLGSLQLSPDSWHVFWDADPPVATMVSPSIIKFGGDPDAGLFRVDWAVGASDAYYNIDVWTYQTEGTIGWKQLAADVPMADGTTGDLLEGNTQSKCRLFICRASDSQIQFITPAGTAPGEEEVGPPTPTYGVPGTPAGEGVVVVRFTANVVDDLGHTWPDDFEIEWTDDAQAVVLSTGQYLDVNSGPTDQGTWNDGGSLAPLSRFHSYYLRARVSGEMTWSSYVHVTWADPRDAT